MPNQRRRIVAARDNPTIIARALYDLGGAGRFVDVEDLLYRAYELSPERFGWRTRALPNYKTLYKALRDFEAAHPAAILKTTDGLGRQLSAEGIDWIENQEQLPEPQDGTVRAQRSVQRLLARLYASSIFEAYVSGSTPRPNRYEVAELLVTAPDGSPDIWRERIETYRAAARLAKRRDLMSFLDYLVMLDPERFGLEGA